MNHTINKERTKLVITIDADEREMLRRMDREGPDSIQSDKAMHEFFEPLIANTELDWFSPEQCGDLTDAPILGIISEAEFKRHNIEIIHNPQCIITSCSTHGLMVAKVAERWGYEPYQVRSPLEDLRDRGECVFSNQW